MSIAPQAASSNTAGKAGVPARSVHLPFGKSVVIAWRSLRARFLRSLVTTLSLVLAVAFLAFSLGVADIVDGMLAAGDPKLREALARAGYDVNAAGLAPKEIWIAILSLATCAVGIVNAQLMAVTERFREIGAMKCLGALDGFILRLCVLEAGMQGVVGATAGAVLGVAGALTAMVLRFGLAAVGRANPAGLVETVGLCALAGLCLSMLGVAYPAWVAARMAPVEAMRAE